MLEMAVEMLGISLSTTWIIVIGVLTIYLMYDFWCHTYWWKQGVPYVPPWPIVANMPVLVKGSLAESFLRLREKYGAVYGLYDFSKPALVCGDPELAKTIMVKSFSAFTNRREFPLNNKELDTSVVNLRDDHWRDVRNTLIPAFSAAKMKQMSYLVNESADKLVENIGIKMDQNGCIECKGLFGSFVMDTVGSCAFGLKLDSQANPSDPFVKYAKNAFEFDMLNPILLLVGIFPSLNGIMRFFNFGVFPHDSIDFFKNVTLKTVAMRKTTSSNADRDDVKTKKVDFLQLMIDAHVSGDDDVVDQEKETEIDIHDELDKQHGAVTQNTMSRRKIKLTDAELVGQAATFFIAGYDTTKTLLTFTSYLLARNPEVQEKLIREIDELLPSRDAVGYSSISKLFYLDQVFCESLRCYPPAAMLDRICSETFKYKDITIPKGMQIIIPIFSMHRDPELWPNPEKFDPERFTKEEREKRHPFAWIPFGGGPRMCLGMRFALMEAKMAMVRVLQKYHFETCPETQIPPTLGKAGLLSPPNGITLRAISRTEN